MPVRIFESPQLPLVSNPWLRREECSRRGVWRTVLARVNPAGDMPGALGEGAEWLGWVGLEQPWAVAEKKI